MIHSHYRKCCLISEYFKFNQNSCNFFAFKNKTVFRNESENSQFEFEKSIAKRKKKYFEFIQLNF